MSTLSLRLPDDFGARVDEEARLSGKTRSEVARQATAEFLERREKERFMAEMVAAARALAADPTARREALELANDLVDEGLDDIIAAEIAAGIDPDEK